MSVAIVSSPVKPAVQSTPADNPAAVESAGSGTDFASLLLGQLAAGAELAHDMPQTPADETDDTVLTTEAGTQDATLMLAALGLPPNEPARKADAEKDARLTPPPGTDRTSSLASLPTTLGGADLKTEANEDASLPTLPGVSDKPAKFAAPDFVPAKAELPAVDTPKSDTPVGGLSTLAAQANNLDHAARNHEAALKLDTPVRSQSWASDFGQKIVWLAANDKQSAQLTLNPPHMGPIEISLNVNKDTASAFFVSQNAEVRETIEAAMPRLREMLAGIGIELGQTNVGAESFRQQAENEAARQGSPRWMGDNAILGEDAGRQLSGQAIVAQRGNGMVDTFA